jgi:hypothetical protein
MRLLLYFAGIFVDTFGITHPSEKGRGRAARYISFLLALVVVLICLVFAGAIYMLHR